MDKSKRTKKQCSLRIVWSKRWRWKEGSAGDTKQKPMRNSAAMKDVTMVLWTVDFSWGTGQRETYAAARGVQIVLSKDTLQMLLGKFAEVKGAAG